MLPRCHTGIPSWARVSTKSVPNRGSNKLITPASNRSRSRFRIKLAPFRSVPPLPKPGSTCNAFISGSPPLGRRGHSSRIVQLEREDRTDEDVHYLLVLPTQRHTREHGH